MTEYITNLDFRILDWVHANMTCLFLDRFMPIITLFGEYGIFFIAAALIMICVKRTRKTGLMMGLSLALGLIICNMILKPGVARIRPYDLRPVDFELLVKKLTDGSFPSGHALASFETASVLMIRDRRFGIPALILGLLISFSRIYMYLHYPSDVIAGIILGTLIGILSVIIINAIWKKAETKIKKQN